jgi:hypothetical protein
MIAVRWNSRLKGQDREKAREIREYGLFQKNPGTDQRVIDTIPRKPYWRKS